MPKTKTKTTIRHYAFYQKNGYGSYVVDAEPVSAEDANASICGLNALKTKDGEIVAFLWDHEMSDPGTAGSSRTASRMATSAPSQGPTPSA
jgi:hypothetical protein